MDIEYYKQFEPIDGKWYITREIGRGAYGLVVEVERHDFSDMKSAMKIISVPSDKSEYEDFCRENFSMKESEIKDYYKSIVKEYIREFQLLSKLKGNSNIVSYEDHDVREKKDSVGWDIFIRMELLCPMSEYFKEHYTRQQVIKLGIDICKALELCSKYNIIHRDIKPSNIFVSNAGDFKLGDFGVARIREKSSANLSARGTYTYMAPEVCHGKGYTVASDIYSLGIVMYKLLNNNYEPFRTGSGYKDAQKALETRLTGKRFAAPANADARLSEIILKACEFDPENRYHSPEEFRKRLEALVAGTYRTEQFDVNAMDVKGRVTLLKNNDVQSNSKDINSLISKKKINKTDSSETDNNERKSIIKTVVAAVISAVCFLIIIFSVGLMHYNGIYNNAQKKFRSNKYIESKDTFKTIAWYKDSEDMILKCDYRRADVYLQEGEYEKAYEIFDMLADYGYHDSAHKRDDCLLENARWYMENGDSESALKYLGYVSAKRQKEADEISVDLRHNLAIELFEKKLYADARKIFVELEDESMINECDYKIGIKHINDGNYARAMSVLSRIIDYSDSKEKFLEAEEILTYENKTGTNFSMYKNLVGRYSNDDGVYVEYKSDSKGNTETSYNLVHDDSEFFKIVDGIHYHRDSNGKWKKQWVFDKVSSNEFDVYNYIDQKVYTLILE